MLLPANFLTATETVALVRSGTLSVEEIARAHLDRVKERDPTVKAWAYLDHDRVLNEARRLDALPIETRGPLHGVLLGVKDIIHTIDMPTQHGSPLFKDDFPKLDAAPVMALRAAGALVMGKTTTTEFAGSMCGTMTCNPVDPIRTPGGSSAGSGAAVADYQVHVALGSQTLGSTIRPASYTGCFSMKPTWGAISREGLKVFATSLDTLGFFARSVQDLSLLADAFQLADSDIPPPSKKLSELKIGVARTVHWPAAQPSVPIILHKAVEILKEGGVEVEEVELGEEFDRMEGLPVKIMFAEARASMLGDYLLHGELLADEFRGHVENRTNITREDQLAAYDLVASLRPKFDKIASEYDAILTPSVPGEAPIGLAHTGDARFCHMWTALHVPVINVPGFAGESGMPVGLTLVSGRYKDRKLLKVAEVVADAFKGAGEGRLKKPPIPQTKARVGGGSG